MSRKFIVFSLLAGLVAWYVYSRTHNGQEKANAKPPVPVSVATAEYKDVPQQVKAVGSVVAYETVSVRPRIESQVVEVRFNDGDEVKKGELLFVLDDRALKAEVVQLEAAARRDAAQLENAKQQYERAKTLVSKGFDSEANLDAAKANYEAQRATLGASSAQVENARVQLGYTRITAPISGRTGTIYYTAGNNVRPTDANPLVIINQVQPIRVHAALPQSDFYALREALNKGKVKAEAMGDNGAKLAEGTLEYIDNALDAKSGTFALRAVFANKDETLWPGMFATLNLTLGVEKDALVLPEVAVQQGQLGDYVFVIKDGKAEKREVTIARMQDGVAVVAKGLEKGEQVATDGLLGLKGGSMVAVRDEAADKTAPPAQKNKKQKAQ